MAKIVYPLAQVLEVKKRRVEEAEKVVLEKRNALEKEKEKLQKCEAERDKVLRHQQDKLKQLRDELDGGTTSDKIQQMKAYLKVVQEKLKVEEKKVAEQKKQVEVAKKNLELAQEDLRKKRLEVDKLELHKKDWHKEMAREQQIIEESELNEIGNVIYSVQQKKSRVLG